MGEELLVHAIHFGEAIHGGEEHVHLDDLLERRACSGENGREVADAQLRHLRDGGAAREREDLARGCAGDLPGAVDRAGRGDGLGLYWRDGGLDWRGERERKGEEAYVGSCGCWEGVSKWGV